MDEKEMMEIMKKAITGKVSLGIEVDEEGNARTTIEGKLVTLLTAYSCLTHNLFKTLQEGMPKALASQIMLSAYSNGISHTEDDGEEEGEE